MKMIACVVFVLGMVCSANPSSAVIVHHCDYDPSTVTQEVHERHDGNNGCGNVDSTGDGQDGYCDIETGFYWSTIDCYDGSCTMAGKIDCGSNDKFYYWTCPGSGADKARVEVDRYKAECDSPTAGQDHSCTCSGSCS